jgi:hypothetical protein
MDRMRLLLMALVVALVTGVAAPAVIAKAPSGDATAAAEITTHAANTFADLPVRGATADGDHFRGRLDVRTFRVRDGQLVALGDLSGALRDADGNLLKRITDKSVVVPVRIGGMSPGNAPALVSTCDILHLTLGPLDLNLLGLVVHLDRIKLDITAQPGPGNLLGNLLCAIAGLLDGSAPLSSLAALLRAIRFIVMNL